MKPLSETDLKALRYLHKHGSAQTFRVADHLGYRFEDRATTHHRARLKRLERHGLVTGERRWSDGPLFWSLTDKGRVEINN